MDKRGSIGDEELILFLFCRLKWEADSYFKKLLCLGLYIEPRANTLLSTQKSLELRFHQISSFKFSMYNTLPPPLSLQKKNPEKWKNMIITIPGFYLPSALFSGAQ